MWKRAEKMQNRGETKVEPGGKKLGVWPNIMWKWTEKCEIEQKKWGICEKRNEETFRRNEESGRKIDESGRNDVETGRTKCGNRKKNVETGRKIEETWLEKMWKRAEKKRK